jgi:hypothetical protein
MKKRMAMVRQQHSKEYWIHQHNKSTRQTKYIDLKEIMEAHWSEWLLQWKHSQDLEKLDPSELHSIRYEAGQKTDTSEHT